MTKFPKCEECNGTGHEFNDEGRVINAYGCRCCDGLGETEAEDE